MLTYLGYNYTQRPGKWVLTPCSIEFNYIWPDNIKDCPYIILTSHGKHMHPPPPPLKVPIQLIKELQ